MARHTAHLVPGNAALSDRLIRRDHAERRYRVRRRMEIRSRHHGAAAFSDAALRSSRRSGEHQLPRTAVGSFAPCVGVWRGVAPRGRTSVPERMAIVGTGGISHWPATPDSGKINEAWDREFLGAGRPMTRQALLSYGDEATYRDAGQGGFEIRTFIAVAAAGRGPGTLNTIGLFPLSRSGCTVAGMSIEVSSE